MTEPSMFIRWRTSSSGEIRRMECVRETDCNIWHVNDLYNSNRGQPLRQPCQERKTAQWHRYHNTWAEAHAHLLKNARDTVERATSRLKEAEKWHEQVWNMKQPTEETQ